MRIAPEAVIFDMDGLLVDSNFAWKSAETKLLQVRGHAFTDEDRQQIIGLRMAETCDRFKAMYGLADSVEDLYEEFKNYMLDFVPTFQERKGAGRLLEFLYDRQTPCAVASSSPIALIDAAMKHHGWESFLPVRCSGDEVERGKPAPDVYLRAAGLLRVEPRDCLALEDSLTGARAAVAAGMTCFAVPDTAHTTPAAFSGITPHCFADLDEVLAILDS